MANKSLGLVKWFDPEKRFGRIGVPGLRDVFLHYNQLVDKTNPKILVATAMIFDVAETTKVCRQLTPIHQHRLRISN
jgi:cold shock CspA family protein